MMIIISLFVLSWSFLKRRSGECLIRHACNQHNQFLFVRLLIYIFCYHFLYSGLLALSFFDFRVVASILLVGSQYLLFCRLLIQVSSIFQLCFCSLLIQVMLSFILMVPQFIQERLLFVPPPLSILNCCVLCLFRYHRALFLSMFFFMFFCAISLDICL